MMSDGGRRWMFHVRQQAGERMSEWVSQEGKVRFFPYINTLSYSLHTYTLHSSYTLKSIISTRRYQVYIHSEPLRLHLLLLLLFLSRLFLRKYFLVSQWMRLFSSSSSSSSLDFNFNFTHTFPSFPVTFPLWLWFGLCVYLCPCVCVSVRVYIVVVFHVHVPVFSVMVEGKK